MAKAKILTHPKFHETQITTASINSLDSIQIEFERLGISFTDEDLESMFEYMYFLAEKRIMNG